MSEAAFSELKSTSAGPSLSEPRCLEFFAVNQLPAPKGERDLRSWWEARTWDFRTESGWNYERLAEGLEAYLQASGLNQGAANIASLEIFRGRDKNGQPERYDLSFKPGDVVCLVGPTGAGKSRFLADIECLAQGDTPTGRVVRLNGKSPEQGTRFSGEKSLVAQITQNMNFVMDLSVGDFLRLHAESRTLQAPDEAVNRVLESAIGMAGEPFRAETPLTQLSGGQSRALMIADAAFLSPKPIILIDEIENAGVDRTRALRLFIEKGKIVFLSTHDPLLALSGAQRLVIRNGAVSEVITPSDKERSHCGRLRNLDRLLSSLRERLRKGERLDDDWEALVGASSGDDCAKEGARTPDGKRGL